METLLYMNIQWESRTDRWFSPVYLVESARVVLGDIDLDPASEAFGNSRVKAKQFYDEKQDGLVQPWFGNLYVNPPGGRQGKLSKSALFWDKLINVRKDIKQAIWLGFSLEQMQTTQRSVKSIANFPFCVPRKRIRFDTPDGTPGAAPSHSNVIVYVPGSIDNTQVFIEEFSQYGVVCVPRLIFYHRMTKAPFRGFLLFYCMIRGCVAGAEQIALFRA